MPMRRKKTEVKKHNLYDVDLFGKELVPDFKGMIAKKFIISPFTVLNAREGFWQERKRAWISMGIKSEVGRDSPAGGGKWPSIDYSGKRGVGVESGTSIFDPVLTELMYTWFCPKNGQIIDPFAGGSVRGIVANALDRNYWGCDLSERQIEANYEQAKEICQSENIPHWVSGDSLTELENAPEADFIFSCPPYGDLEVYSDDSRDISNMDYHEFKKAYNRIVFQACKKLKNNRFACFVVSNYRDKKGNYNNLVGDTVAAFEECGLYFYGIIPLLV